MHAYITMAIVAMIDFVVSLTPRRRPLPADIRRHHHHRQEESGYIEQERVGGRRLLTFDHTRKSQQQFNS